MEYLPIMPTLTDSFCMSLSIFAELVDEDSAHILVLFARLLDVATIDDLCHRWIEGSWIRLCSRILAEI